MKILNIAGYQFVELSELTAWWETLLAFCQTNEIKGTIILSPEGINLNLAGIESNLHQLTDYLTSFPEFAQMQFKRSYSDNIPFKRLRVKIKRELTPVKQPGITLSYQPKYVSPKQLKAWLAEGKATLVDTRNQFEYQLGTFDNAIDLNMENFNEFPEAIKQLDPSLKKRPVVIFCTGGIRCEKAAPIMEQQGFSEVYQLHGGILDYFADCGDAHFHGSCFVFDQRVALNSNLQQCDQV